MMGMGVDVCVGVAVNSRVGVEVTFEIVDGLVIETVPVAAN